jgi:hypothetical protein
MLLTSHIRGHILSLKFHPQNCMQMVIGIQHLQTPISSPAAPKMHFQEEKTIQLFKKLTCAKTLKEAHTKESHRAQSPPYARLCTRKVTHFCEWCLYGSCWPLTQLWTSSQLDLILKSKMNLNGGLVKDLRVPLRAPFPH